MKHSRTGRILSRVVALLLVPSIGGIHSRSTPFRLVTNIISIVIIGLLVVLPIKQFALSATTSAAAQMQRDRIEIDFHTIMDVPVELWAPIEQAVHTDREQVLPEDRLVVSALRYTEDWMYAVLLPIHEVEAGMETIQPDQSVEILGRRDSHGQWTAAIAGSSQFLALAREVPADFIDLSDLLNPLLASSLNFLFPWTNGHAWYKTQGWHLNFTNSGSYNAMDFQPVNRSNPAIDFAVLAAEAGRLESFCSDRSDQSWLKITHPNGQVSLYGHIQSSTIPQRLLGQQVQRGQFLGRIYINGSIGNGYQTSCGWGTAGHLHFVLPTRNMQINGHWANTVSSALWATQYRSSNVRTDNNIAVGQNSSRQQVFQVAYEATRLGTMYNINYGTPTTVADWYRGFVRQDFSNGVSLIHDEDSDRPTHSIPAYPIAGDFRAYWEQNLQQLGPPTSNQIRNGSGQDEQHFRHGRVRRISGRLVFERWPTEADCVRQGKWRLEVINLFHFYPGGVDTRRGMTWPPNQNLSAGPSMVTCVTPTKPGYALFYDVEWESPYFERSTHDQGLWRNHWLARLSGKVSGLPASNFVQVSAACDDGCVIDIRSQTFPWWRQQIASWRDQPASHVDWAWVQNGDQVNVTWYEREGMARVWLKQGLQALTLPPLSAQCDAQIRIADGAPVINTPATTLTITAADAAEMKVSRLEDLSDASWQPVTTTLDWQLEPATGVITHTVYAQFRDDTEETLCQGAIIADDILLDTLPPTGTATIAANDAISVTLQLDAGDQPDGSGVAYVAIFPVLADEEAQLSALDELPEEIWQAYEPQITVFKPMTLMGETEVNYQIWFRDAAGNVAEPITIAVPQVEPPPPPDEPTPDEPTPDEPNPPPTDGRSQSVYLPLVIR